MAVVGAGITGLALARMLRKQGRQVAVLEARSPGHGTTGATSAHVTEVPEGGYRSLLGRLGPEGAAAIAEAYRAALDWIEASIAESGIKCGFVRVPAYLFGESEHDAAQIRKEAEAAARVGVGARLADVPLPCAVAAGLLYPDQAQFHPIDYLDGLAADFVAAGGLLFEDTRVVGVREGDGAVCLRSERATVRAQAAILATHTPLGFNLMQTLLAPYRSYVLALRLRQPLARALFWDTATPYHYLRTQSHPSLGSLLIVGGEDHKTGHGEDAPAAFMQLLEYARARFDVGEIVHRWSSQLYEPADGLPYVGRSPFAERVFLATGYSGTGLVPGVSAAMLLAELLAGRDRPASRLLRAARLSPIHAARRLTSENLDAASHWLGDRLRGPEADDLEGIPPGAGKLVDVGGKRLAVHRGADGTLQALSPVCTHLGCIVRWNAAERSWDCPCHGGRFAPDGSVLAGPPVTGLARKPV